MKLLQRPAVDRQIFHITTFHIEQVKMIKALLIQQNMGFTIVNIYSHKYNITF